MAQLKSITATRRSGTGTGAARAIRRSGRLPAIIYGGGEAPMPIALDFKETNRLIQAGHFRSALISIELDDETIRAIPRDYQLDVVRDFPIHVDFLRLAEGASLRIDVPVHIAGQEDSPGLKEGGALNIVSHTVSLLVPVDAIPDAVVVDVSAMKIGESIHLSAVPLPQGAKIQGHDNDATLVTLVAAGGEKRE